MYKWEQEIHAANVIKARHDQTMSLYQNTCGKIKKRMQKKCMQLYQKINNKEATSIQQKG